MMQARSLKGGGVKMEDFDLKAEYGDLVERIGSYISELDVDSVQHYGVKGMHWGVRKSDSGSGREPLKSLGPDSVSVKTASGETVTLQKVKPGVLPKALGRISKKYREGYAKQAMMDIRDGSGKKIGDAVVQKKNDDELYLNWLGIKKSARGRGYATAVMKAGRDFGKQQGFKRMTLEVPGNSPDARHIYEKLGFKVVKEGNPAEDPFWGGLTDMVYEFDAKHSALAHYGVKGMKWGVRKARTGDLNVKASRHERVAAGKGSLVDKTVTLGGSSLFNLARSGGLKKEAARRARNERAQIERLSTGKAKVTDLLRAYGTVSVYSLIGSTRTKTDFVPGKG